MANENPHVWKRFEKTRKCGTVVKFKIQEVPVNRYNDVIEFMITNFLPYEPFVLSADIYNDPEAIELLKQFWLKYVLPQNRTLLCLEDNNDDNPEIVGLNFLLHCVKGKENTPKDACEPPSILHILQEISSRFDVYETFGVEQYIGGAGLAVSKKYQGMNIGAEILLARTPLCKAHGIKLTETIFTSVGSQVLAAKAGFVSQLDIEFSDLAQKLNITFPDGFKTLKVMTKIID